MIGGLIQAGMQAVAKTTNGAFGIFSTQMEYSAKNASHDYNQMQMQEQEDYYRLKAEQELSLGKSLKHEKLNQTALLSGTQTAMAGASGTVVGEGSISEIIEQSQKYGMVDADTLEYNQKLKAWDADVKATQAYNSRQLDKSQQWMGNRAKELGMLRSAFQVFGI